MKYDKSMVSKRFETDRPALISLIAVVVLLTVLAIAFFASPATEEVSDTRDAQQTAHDEHANHSPAEHRVAISQDAADIKTEGTDPASRQQATLASAASAPNSGSNRGDNPAAGVSGGNNKVDPETQLGNRETSGVSSSGCAVGYGRMGEQCVPARAPGGGTTTCVDVRKQFPGGIAVTGNDQLQLDKNDDGVACGQGD